MTSTPAALSDAAALPLDHSGAVVDGKHSHGGIPQASRAERRTSFDPDDFPVPSGREEEWRFTPVELLTDLMSVANLDPVSATVTVDVSPGVISENVSREDSRLGQIGVPGDRTAVVAWAGFERATVVTVTPDAAVEPTIVKVQVGENPGVTHLLVRAEPSARGIVVIDHTGAGALTETVEILAEAGSDLTVVAVQDWDPDTRHTSAHRITIGQEATVKHIVVTLGGNLVRVAPDAQFVGEGGSFTGLGLYFADAGQYLEHRLFVDHAVPACRSRVTYKGALQGAGAHTVWIGDVLIRAAAEGTDTYEENRNLVLTDGARADSVPNLEIETGEIQGAGHASATGRFDDEQLFYLRSRGIPEQEARQLVVRGFFADMLRQIGIADLEARLLSRLEVKLAGWLGQEAPK